jgi:hypothetical protein
VSNGCDSFQQFMFRPSGFPVPSANGEFLMKNIALFGLTLWLLADAIDANPQTSNAGHQPYPSPPKRTLWFTARVNHPGEYVIGVMTAHPAWPQSEYDQNRAGLSARLRGAQLRPLRVVDTKNGGPVGAVKDNQEGTPNMHFEAKKVIVVGGPSSTSAACGHIRPLA